jgi:hypothetical protein
MDKPQLSPLNFAASRPPCDFCTNTAAVAAELGKTLGEGRACKSHEHALEALGQRLSIPGVAPASILSSFTPRLRESAVKRIQNRRPGQTYAPGRQPDPPSSPYDSFTTALLI